MLFISKFIYEFVWINYAIVNSRVYFQRDIIFGDHSLGSEVYYTCFHINLNYIFSPGVYHMKSWPDHPLVTTKIL